MKTTAHKPAKSHSSTVTRSGGFFKASGSPGFFGPVVRKASASPPIQTSGLSVSKPGDPLEKAADRTADAVMRMPAETVQRAAPPNQVQRTGGGTPTVAADATSEIQHAASGGQGLSSELRSFMEPRLGADLGGVRVHADEGAHSLSNHLSARAFTFRNHVFFGRGQYQPGTDAGRHLIAHELTHTIQQGATVQRAPDTAVQAATAPELQRTEQPVVQRSTQPDVRRSPAAEVARVPHVAASGSAPAVQRMGVIGQKALDHFADAANNIMGFRMLTLVLGFNPINQHRADRTPANILRALIELVPGGALITRALDTHGVINKAATWVEEKVKTLGDIGGQIVQAVKDFVSGLSWTDVGSLSGLWDRAKRLVTDPIARLISFGTGVVGELLTLVREAILKPLAALAEGTRGYDLLKAILGQDPITGEWFPPTADNLIGGFMKLIGQEEVWLNIKRGNAVPRAWAWFQGALAGIKRFATSIPARITGTLASLTFPDVVSVVGAFNKVKSAFVDVAGQFFAWAGKQVLTLLEILVSVVAPGVMPYIAKAKAAFQTIVKDPVRFVGHLVRAGRLGFQKFADNILEHLKSALIKWLVGPLAQAGVYIPKSFSLLEIVKLVLSVLGLTWQNIRTKLVKIIPEPVLAGLEKTAKVLVTLVTDGPAAAWEEIKNELTELKDQLIGQVTSMIQMEVVKAAITKLVMMLNPAGAVVQAITAIWKTVTFFIEKAQQIGAVVASFIDSIAAIAAGQVENAAKRVERTMADTLVVVIGFLANFAGLGGIPTKLVGIVKKVRAPIDKGLDKIVAWLGKMLDKLKDTVAGRKEETPEQKKRRLDGGIAAAVSAVNRLPGKTVGDKLARPILALLRFKHGLTKLELVSMSDRREVAGELNPKSSMKTNKVATKIASKYVVDGTDQLKDEYAKEIREWFYKKNFRKQNKEKVLAASRSKVPTTVSVLNKKDDLYWCAGHQSPGHVIGKSEVTIDHEVLPVASHWNKTGRDAKQNERYDWYDSPDNLVVLCRPHNSSKGSTVNGAKSNYEPTVGEKFKGYQEN